MSMRAMSRTALVLLSCGLLGACGGNDWDDVTADGPLLLSSGSSDEGMTAEVGGPVTLREGCVSVGEHPAVWPEGTVWDSQRAVLTLPDRVEVALGEEVTGAGGYYDQQSMPVEDHPTDVADLLRSCLGPSGEVAMFNPGQPIEKRD